MTQVIAEGGANPMKLLLLKKPLLYEGHKGGQVMIDTSDPATSASPAARERPRQRRLHQGPRDLLIAAKKRDAPDAMGGVAPGRGSREGQIRSRRR